MLGMRTCLPCHIPDRWSRNANRIWPDLRPDLAFGSVHKLYIRLVVGTARISTLEKRNVDCMTEKLNILKVSQVPVMLLLSLTTSRQPVTSFGLLRVWLLSIWKFIFCRLSKRNSNRNRTEIKRRGYTQPHDKFSIVLSKFISDFAESLFVSTGAHHSWYPLLSRNIIFCPAQTMAARVKKNFLAERFAQAISVSVHYRDFEHAYVYWIWLRGSASYVIFNKLTSDFYASVLLLTMNFVITLSK